MKKLVVIGLVIVCLVIAAVSFGSGNRMERIEEMEAQDTVRVEGLIVTVEDGSFLLQEKELGEIRVNFDASSVFEGVTAEELFFGQYVFVDFDGKMTRSLPPQIFAQKVGMYPVSGVVAEVGEGSITVNQGEAGDVIIHLLDDKLEISVGDEIIAYTNGAMTMSLPPQTTALALDIVASAE